MPETKTDFGGQRYQGSSDHGATVTLIDGSGKIGNATMIGGIVVKN